MQMPDGAAVSGTVTDAAGDPLSDVPVNIEGVSGTDPAGYTNEITQTTTDDSGNYIVGNLTAGTDYEACFGQFIEPLVAATAYNLSCYQDPANPGSPALLDLTADQFLTGIDVEVTPDSADAAAPGSRTGAAASTLPAGAVYSLTTENGGTLTSTYARTRQRTFPPVALGRNSTEGGNVVGIGVAARAD
jgi:hypothetical protein